MVEQEIEPEARSSVSLENFEVPNYPMAGGWLVGHYDDPGAGHRQATAETALQDFLAHSRGRIDTFHQPSFPAPAGFGRPLGHPSRAVHHRYAWCRFVLGAIESNGCSGTPAANEILDRAESSRPTMFQA